ncbi:MAG: AraC family ligand binding domain-containing protein, partial [Chitinophagaceae bacterium]
MKQNSNLLKNYKLDQSFHQVHKDRTGVGDFGLDNTSQLICNGFGLYSSAGLKQKIGPIKSEFFRIGFGVSGSVQIHCGLETFHFTPGSIAFTFPGQVFSFHDRSEDMFVYYMLFTEEFISDAVSLKQIRTDFPFLNYTGTPCFQLDKMEAKEIQEIILKLNDEIKLHREDLKQFIQLHIQLILLQANRSYQKLKLQLPSTEKGDHTIVNQYKKLVSQLFINKRKVSDYAKMLFITANHLNKLIKNETGKTAHELIEEMLLLEAKALIIHT